MFVSCVLTSQLWFCNGFWILSALVIHKLGIHLGILSVYLGSLSFVSFIPAMLHIYSSFHHIDLGSIVSMLLILGPLCPSIFPILGPNVPTCTSLSDSALQFRP